MFRDNHCIYRITCERGRTPTHATALVTSFNNRVLARNAREPKRMTNLVVACFLTFFVVVYSSPLTFRGFHGVKNVICPDEQSECPDGDTCCELSSGQWGCCPLPHAVCCSDHLHCCPNGYTCDVSAGTCTRGTNSIPFLKKNPSKPVVKAEPNIVCPDERSTCPTGDTCCELASGQYGCCPLPNAVCCSDHLHCCPNGYTCDVSAGTCTRGTNSIPFLKKNPSKPVVKAEPNTMCPGDQSQCPGDDTCCKLASGQWGCCPLPNAVCCSDHLHCCPNGYTCDVSAGTCTRGTNSIPFLKKNPSKPVVKAEPNTMCPGDQSQCPGDDTCCKLASGQWGCCPLPNAVCCSDHLHCCPNGYTCDVSAGTCTRGTNSIPFLKKNPSKPVVKAEPNIVCPDERSTCPTGDTCCELASGQYGCCPLPNAVCCSDHLHCCPNGYTCDVSAGTCTRGANSIPFLKKNPSKPVVKAEPNTMCPGDQSQCPGDDTCCKLASGQWGCCPLPNAVCCSDHLHCCPNGYTCDVSAGTCTRGTSVMPLFLKKEAEPNSL